MPASISDPVGPVRRPDVRVGRDPAVLWTLPVHPHGLARGSRASWTTGTPLCLHSPPLRDRMSHPAPGHPCDTLSLPVSPRSAAAARRFSARLLTEWGLDGLADDAALLLSEIVTNAVVHVPGTTGRIEVTLTRADGALLAQVTDSGPADECADAGLPRCAQAGPDSENGRGMWLVEQIADRWGHHASGAGRTVWFVLTLP
ncbi:ATP-binding protein [Streptomyces gamaensis]|uniref:ATP-binding protein n=1 Tax=Streptomyces gamaensis TaxID=1763542 RepID=A0ABW0YZ36_9ACTN